MADRHRRAIASTSPVAGRAIVAGAHALIGASRVLWVMPRRDGLEVAASRLPGNEQAADLLRAVTPWLIEARRTGLPRLRHGPDGAERQLQRSCIVVPSAAGFLYADIDGWQELYPAVDVMQQLRAMRGWIDANPQNRKTRAGIRRFVNGWLSKEQNRGGSAKTSPPA